MLDVERDAELERRQRDATLQHRAGRVEPGDGFAPRPVVAAQLQLGHQLVNDVVGHDLVVRCDVFFGFSVKVGAPHIERIAPELAGDSVQDVLDRDGALRPAKATERGVALRVGPGRIAVHGDVGQPVGVVEVTQRARHHRARQVGRMASPRHHRNLGTEDAALVVVADLVVVPEAVAPASDQEVVIAVEPQLDRALQPAGRHRRDAGEDRRLRFLAAKRTAHAPAFHLHFIGMQVQRMRDQVLHLARMLGRAVDMHRTAFFGDRVADLAFQIELLLATDIELRAEAMRCRGDGRLRTAWVGAAGQVDRRQHVQAFGVRVARRQHRWAGVDAQHVPGFGSGATRRITGLGDHREHRLAEVANLAP